MVRSVPMRWVANRARKSEPPQVTAVSRPNRIPIKLVSHSTRQETSRRTIFYNDVLILGSGSRLGGLCLFYFESQLSHHLLQIFPHFALRRRITQQISGMIGGHQLPSAKLQPLPAKLRYPPGGLQYGLRRDASQTNDHFGSNQVNLPKQKWRARRHFISFRRAILRRPAFHHVAYVHIAAPQPHGFDHLRKQFPGATYKWQPLQIFIASRAFPDKKQFRLRMPIAKHNFSAPLVQLAAYAITDVFANGLKRAFADVGYRSYQRRWRGRFIHGFDAFIGHGYCGLCRDFLK